jgi:hypothetical protein
MQRQHNEIYQTLFVKGEEGGGSGNIMEGGELVQSTLYGITTIKPPCIVNVC